MPFAKATPESTNSAQRSARSRLRWLKRCRITERRHDSLDLATLGIYFRQAGERGDSRDFSPLMLLCIFSRLPSSGHHSLVVAWTVSSSRAKMRLPWRRFASSCNIGTLHLPRGLCRTNGNVSSDRRMTMMLIEPDISVQRVHSEIRFSKCWKKIAGWSLSREAFPVLSAEASFLRTQGIDLLLRLVSVKLQRFFLLEGRATSANGRAVEGINFENLSFLLITCRM